MSHFSLIVTNTLEENYNKQLEPFYEQGEPSDYFMEEQVEIPKAQLKKKAKEALDNLKDNDAYPEVKQLYDDGKYAQVCTSYYGGRINSTGDLCFYFNPQAKWDWYEIGGRWTGYFKLTDKAKDTPYIGGHYSMSKEEIQALKDKRHTDVAKVGEIDWEAMREERRKSAEKDWKKYQAKLKEEPDYKMGYWEYGVLPNDTLESLVKRRQNIAPFAILHNGEWYEKGEMGWFGQASNEKSDELWEKTFERLIMGLPSDTEISLIDCHI